MATPSQTVYIVPHTHWDREWYSTFETFRGQLVELWDELLALTEADPDFRFLMDGQSVVIDDYLEIRPENRARLDAAVQRGQIQVGPWYTLPDEFLVSGETLVRDLERGLAGATAHGGSMRVGYLPDSFGHAAQMPQLYRQFGFAHAAVWRGVPLSIDRVAFLWEAPDGSEVLTAYMGNSYSHGVDLPTEADALAARIQQALAAIAPFQPGPDVLLMNGNDHVLPQRALTQAVRQATGRRNGTAIRLARLDDYLALLPGEPWPRWRGELRSSARANVLMGTLSVRVADKQAYARATRQLERLAEPLAALSRDAATESLRDAWTLILQNAAHDTACGSGIDEVAEAARRRSVAALAIAEAVVERCLPSLVRKGEVWNPSPFPRQEVVDVGGVPRLIAAVEGFATARLSPVEPSAAVAVGSRRIENAWLSVEVNPEGTFIVVDKERGLRYEGLNRLVDEGDAGDEYNFSPVEENDAWPQRLEEVNVVPLEQHPARAWLEVRFTGSVPGGLSHDRRRRGDGQVPMPVRMVLELAADSSRLDLTVELENRARDHRLRVHFPLPYSVTDSAADTPFHVTRRPVHAAHRDPGAPELELPTYPMRSFVDLSDGTAGMALITDGLHEYEVIPGPKTELALTVLRAVGWLSRDDLSTRTGHAGPGLETPGAQALGRHRFRYSLFFHRGDWEQGGVWRAAERALLPLLLGRGTGAQPVSPTIDLSPASIQLTACIPTNGGYELRLLNASERPADAVIRLAPQPGAIIARTLDGSSARPLSASDGRVRLSMRAWEIVTLGVSG
ncbi:MAG TPA: glycoside hydrolase family 38 C-terminal domain-containing protein [Candidatus Dormibacteraeota bacterium]